MKKLFTVAVFMMHVGCRSYGQNNFNSFVKSFPTLHVPIEHIGKIHPKDTLDINFANEILVTNQKLPYYTKDDKQVEVDQYYGQIMKGSTSYTITDSDEIVNFSTKAYAVGKINLSNNYISLIVKVVALESTFYDIYSFTKGGTLKSFLPPLLRVSRCTPRGSKFLSNRI